MIRMTAAQYRQYMQRQAAEKPKKHRNKFVYVYEDGWIGDTKDLPNHGKVVRRYDSIKEFNRHKELEMLEKAGKITNLSWQVPLLLQDAFTGQDGKTIKAMYYNADFMYNVDGKTVVEDVKGIDKTTGKPQTTETFRVKWKLLQGRYRQYIFRIA